MTSWTVSHQALLCMGFSRQEHWSGLPCPPPGDLPNPGVEFESPALAGSFFSAEPQGEPFLLLEYSGCPFRECKHSLASRRCTLCWWAVCRSDLLTYPGMDELVKAQPHQFFCCAYKLFSFGLRRAFCPGKVIRSSCCDLS